MKKINLRELYPDAYREDGHRRNGDAHLYT